MAYALERIEWCEVPLVRPVSDPAWVGESAMGKATSAAQYLTPVRWLLHGEELMQLRVTPNVSVALSGLIGLVVAMDNSCRHCYGAFRSMLKIMGYSEALIRNLEETIATNKLTRKENAALEFARKVSRSAPRPSESDLQDLTAAGFSAIEIAEIAYLAGINACGNRLATLLALPPDPLEEVEANWFTKLKRPFSRKDFRAAASRVFTPQYPADYSGPGRIILDALEGSPAAAALATVLRGAWNSPVTARRVKALIFMVVAHGLNCDACEAEAAKVRRDEGWTNAEIEHLLTYLDSEKLDPLEQRVLHFARETVRYQTRRLQQLAQDFAKGLERNVLLEIIGLIAYANALARMSIMLHRC
jgi:alkylhydroperoxidase family enzyme